MRTSRYEEEGLNEVLIIHIVVMVTLNWGVEGLCGT